MARLYMDLLVVPWKAFVVFPILLALPVAAPSRTTTSPSRKAVPIVTSGEVEGIHDPSIIYERSKWYVFSTTTGKAQGELPIHCSDDLHQWKSCGSVLKSIPEWIQKESPQTRNLWAPDVSFFNGQFHLYYAFSVFGKNTSGIALLTNKTLDSRSPDYFWRDEGRVLTSRLTDNFNAIDPNVVLDENGTPWLSFGSFWGGIKMRRLDAKSGKTSTSDQTLYSLAMRKRPGNPESAKPGLPPDWQAIEAPFIFRHDNYYYLFVSYDLCCRGTHSTYKIAVGRSLKVTGPYLDKEGVPMMEGGGSVILTGNQRWVGPGGESLSYGPGVDLIAFHAYDGSSGRPSLLISTISWTDGWPEIALPDR